MRRSERLGDRVLHVYVAAFEELRAPRHAARVELVVVLSGDDGGALLDRRYEHSEPIASDEPRAFVEAIGRALDLVVRDIAGDLTAATQTD